MINLSPLPPGDHRNWYAFLELLDEALRPVRKSCRKKRP